MRKKTIRNVADTVFWYSLYMLPLIVLLVSIFQVLGNEAYMTEYFGVTGNDSDLIFNVFQYSCEPLYEMFSLVGIFDDFLALFMDLGFVTDSYLYWFIMDYLLYFILVYLLHVCVDFLLFIPRLAHKWMNAFTRED